MLFINVSKHKYRTSVRRRRNTRSHRTLKLQ